VCFLQVLEASTGYNVLLQQNTISYINGSRVELQSLTHASIFALFAALFTVGAPSRVKLLAFQGFVFVDLLVALGVGAVTIYRLWAPDSVFAGYSVSSLATGSTIYQASTLVMFMAFRGLCIYVAELAKQSLARQADMPLLVQESDGVPIPYTVAGDANDDERYAVLAMRRLAAIAVFVFVCGVIQPWLACINRQVCGETEFILLQLLIMASPISVIALLVPLLTTKRTVLIITCAVIVSDAVLSVIRIGVAVGEILGGLIGYKDVLAVFAVDMFFNMFILFAFEFAVVLAISRAVGTMSRASTHGDGAIVRVVTQN